MRQKIRLGVGSDLQLFQRIIGQRFGTQDGRGNRCLETRSSVRPLDYHKRGTHGEDSR